MSGFYLPSSTPASTTPSSRALSPTSGAYFSSPPMHSTFYSSDEGADEEEDTLPYPLPLPRSAFLSPTFTPATYLSTLRNRHQTLEDLRSDLRIRVQEVSRELVALVNDEYEDFLSVGGTLRGGEEKVEEVRLGVLGFKREVEGVRDVLAGRHGEVRALLEQRKRVRRELVVGRRILEWEERVRELEARLMVGGAGAGVDDDNEEEEDEYEDDGCGEAVGGAAAAVPKLYAHAQLYLQIRQLAEQIGSHPFLNGVQEARMLRTRNTLLLDLNAVTRQLKAAGPSASRSLLRVMQIYGQLGEGGEAIKTVKTVG